MKMPTNLQQDPCKKRTISDRLDAGCIVRPTVDRWIAAIGSDKRFLPEVCRLGTCWTIDECLQLRDKTRSWFG